jgi:hypothetical protein
MDELLTEELAVRRLQEKMDDAFRAAMQRTINAGEEKHRPWFRKTRHSKFEDCLG